MSIRIKTTVLILFILLIQIKAAQENSENIDKYDRISLTLYFFTYGNHYANRINESIKTISLPDRFDNNNLKVKTISIPNFWDVNINEYEKVTEEGASDRLKVAEDYLNDNNIGKQIIGYCYNYDPDKGFDLTRIFERAEYNATDEDIMVASSSKRGLAQIKDYGHQLVNNSYIVIIDLMDINREVSRKDNSVGISYTAHTGIYLFKLNSDKNKINKFFQYWVNEDDNEIVKKQKLEAFKNEFTVPFEFVFSKPNNSLVLGNDSYTKLEAQIGKSKSIDELDKNAFNNLIQSCYNDILTTLSKNIEAFQIESKVIDLKPVRSKIGKKEDLRSDDKYFVYEYILEEDSNTPTPKRKAVVRSNKIADNRGDNRSATSTFYQTYGGRIEEGMVMREKRDIGISINGNYENMGIGGCNFQIKYRAGRFIKIPALYVFYEMGFNKYDYSQLDETSYTYLPKFETDTLSFIRIGFGIGKGFQFLHNFELTPYVALGINGPMDNNKDDYNYNTLYYKCGASLGLNILQNLQLYGQINYYGYGSVDVTDSNNEQIEDMGGEKWDNEFPNQSGLFYGFGLQFEF